MTPAARVAAAIEILDRHLSGTPAEQALTGWARSHRFAGSGDRAAIRDHVFDALRCRRSQAALGGGEDGRALLLGGLRAAGLDPAAYFTGEGHAPAPLSAAEAALAAQPLAEALATLPPAVAGDCPDWLVPRFEDALGADAPAVLALMRARAPVFLRVNTGLGNMAAAQRALAAEGIETRPHPLAATALEVTAKAQKLRNSRAYAEGLVELQDAASQAVVEALPLGEATRVLDYCAGGGGKVLAMAPRAPRAMLYAHDAAPQRMRDLPERARRAGIGVKRLAGSELKLHGPYDLVLTDVPCSGSGSWRRAPEAKWAFEPGRLAALERTQAEILDAARLLVAPGGTLAYATCSLFEAENGAQVAAFCARHPEWRLHSDRRLTPLDGGDGFYLALLRRG